MSRRWRLRGKGNTWPAGKLGGGNQDAAVNQEEGETIVKRTDCRENGVTLNSLENVV